MTTLHVLFIGLSFTLALFATTLSVFMFSIERIERFWTPYPYIMGMMGLGMFFVCLLAIHTL